jgi:hypothetical protein
MNAGCRLGQGYLFSAPLEKHEFEQFLRTPTLASTTDAQRVDALPSGRELR